MDMKLHESLTDDVIIEAVEREMFGTDNPGFCIVCGEEDDYCEPDVRGKRCEACGRMTVYGAAEILISLGI